MNVRAIALPIAVLALWECAGRTVFQPSDTTTRPSDIVVAIAGAASDGSLAKATLETLSAASIGFAVAAALGILFAIPLGLSREFRSVTGLVIEFLRPIPA